MLRVSSVTVKTFDVCGKRSAVTVMSSGVDTSRTISETFRDSSTSLGMTSGACADASHQLGDRKNLGCLLEEVRCQLHSGYKFNHRDRSERRFYFVRRPVGRLCPSAANRVIGPARF